MTKYMVKVTEAEVYHVEVEAESKDEAVEEAVKKWELIEGNEKNKYWQDSDGDIETICKSSQY